MDARYNPNKIVGHINQCHSKLQNVKITSLDFEDVIKEDGSEVLLYLDPPYYHKGNQLYQQGMSKEDHIRLASTLKECKHVFFLSYDNCEEIRSLYESWAYLCDEEWMYSVSNKDKVRKQGKELFISNIKV